MKTTMKTTMKKSPLKQGFMEVSNPAKKAIDTVTAAYKAGKAKKDAASANASKAGSKNGIKEKAIASRAADKKAKPTVEGKPARPTVKAKVNLEKTPAMQMKKSKC